LVSGGRWGVAPGERGDQLVAASLRAVGALGGCGLPPRLVDPGVRLGPGPGGGVGRLSVAHGLRIQ